MAASGGSGTIQQFSDGERFSIYSHYVIASLAYFQQNLAQTQRSQCLIGFNLRSM